MLRNHPAAELLKDYHALDAVAANSVLDDAKTKAAAAAAAAEAAAAGVSVQFNGVTLDSATFGKLMLQADWMKMEAPEVRGFAVDNGVDPSVLDAANPVLILDAAGDYQDNDTALAAVAAVQEWAETPPSDLDEGEGAGDRLSALLAGIADQDLDGEVSDAEADIINDAANAACDYLIAKGVPEDDAVSLLTDFDNDLAETVQELILTSLPEGDEAAAEEIDQFVFGDGSDESVLDATYRKKVAIRRGKKVRINKRISGTVRLSAKQKVAVRKMLRKTHSAVAKARRAKSMRVRKQAGL